VLRITPILDVFVSELFSESFVFPYGGNKPLIFSLPLCCTSYAVRNAVQQAYVVVYEGFDF